MQNTRLYCCLLALWLFPSKNFIAQPTTSRLKTLDSTLVALHDQAMFNGVVLVAQNGKILYQKALGVADCRTNAPLTTRSSFNLASVSKQFVGVMILQLKERRLLGLDDKVSQYLPSFPYPSVTIRHLLTHTSGLPEYFDLVLQHKNTLDTLTNDKLLALLAEQKPQPNFEAGAQWQYCNTGYVLLASIIEKVAQMPVATFFKQNIAAPLGLKNTLVYSLTIKEPWPRSVQRVYGFERKHGKPVLNDLIRLDGVVGDGNIYASAEDLLAWDQALYTDKLLPQAALREAFTPVRLNDGHTHPYGFGWSLDASGTVFSHTGSWVGFLNGIERNTAAKTTVIFLSNGTDGTARRIAMAILKGEKAALPKTQLIRNVRLVDGTRAAVRRDDVRLRDDKIWEIGSLTPFPNEAVVDGQGQVLAPGFIDAHSHHFGGLNKAPEAIPSLNQGVTTIVIGQDGNSYPMDTLAHFVKTKPVAVNIASYTGHSTLRAAVMGANDLYRTAKTDEVERMKAMLQQEMDKGSLGLNTGLEYEEAFFSNRTEVLELAKVAAKAGGRYMSHIRSEDISMDEAVDEIIEIGRKAKLPVQISHIKIAKKDQWKTSPALLAKLQDARAEGIDITADCYPYNFWNSTLRVLFPNRDYTNPASAEFATNQLFDPEQSVLVRFAPNPVYAGKTLSEVARLRNERPAQTLMALIAIAADFEDKNPDFDEGVEAIMGKSMDDYDVSNLLLWPHTNICSDGSSGGHPRGHGAFTRVLGRYVREQKLMSLETAIHKMTGLTAEQLGIAERGLISPGHYADLVLLNPDTVLDKADIQNGKALSDGIEKVWVNGQIVYENKRPTGRYPGALIYRGTK